MVRRPGSKWESEVLRRAIVALLSLAVVGFSSVVAPLVAHADSGCLKYDESSGACTLEVEVPGTSGGSNNGSSNGSVRSGGNSSTASGPRVCESKAGKPIPCSSPNGSWYAPGECYAKAAAPELQDVKVTGAGNALYTCTPLLGGVPFEITLPIGAAGAPPPPPDPAVLAARAVAQMGLHAVKIGIVPEPRQGSVGIIGLPTWMWVADPGPSTTGPITRSLSERGFTVTATAKATRVVWRMGDGANVSCLGRGTPYEDSYGRQSSPDCGHTYTKSGRYTVQATSYWTVEWEGIAQTGEIPIDFTADTAITMGESQVIVTG